jgi:hypothetical protein
MGRGDGEGMEERLSEIGKRIDQLKGQMGTVSSEIQADLTRRIDAVEVEQKEQLQRLHRLKDQGLEQWDTHVDQADKVWKGVKKSLQDLASRLMK